MYFVSTNAVRYFVFVTSDIHRYSTFRLLCTFNMSQLTQKRGKTKTESAVIGFAVQKRVSVTHNAGV